MSSPPPSETSTLPVTLSSFKNALIKSSKKAKKEPNQQEQSILIQKLPPKIRKIIWQYMIGGNKINLEDETILRMQRFWPFKYKLPQPEFRWRSTIQTDDGSNHIDQFLPRLENVSALVKTCRLL